MKNILSKSIKISVFTIVCFAYSSCNMVCTKGTGEAQMSKRTIKQFTSLNLDLAADVTVKKGTTDYIEIEAQANLLDKIITDVSGDKLEIKSQGCISSGKDIKITVYMNDIEKLEIGGSGNIAIPDTLVVKNLKLVIGGSGTIEGKFIASKIESEIEGSGDIILTGSADEQTASVSGSGTINAKLLPCNEAKVEVDGSGDVSVYVLKKLEINVNGSGNVRYAGKPSVNSHIEGSGAVIDEN